MNKEDHIIDPAAPATAIDEVVTLGIRLNATRLLEAELEQKEFDAIRANEYVGSCCLDRALCHASDEGDALRSMLAYARSTTMVGAGIQINEALILADLILDRIPSEARTGPVKRDARRLSRILYSVLDFINSVADPKLENVIGELLQPNLNPWMPVEVALDAARARR